jgi:hypothetical protein
MLAGGLIAAAWIESPPRERLGARVAAAAA